MVGGTSHPYGSVKFACAGRRTAVGAPAPSRCGALALVTILNIYYFGAPSSCEMGHAGRGMRTRAHRTRMGYVKFACRPPLLQHGSWLARVTPSIPYKQVYKFSAFGGWRGPHRPRRRQGSAVVQLPPLPACLVRVLRVWGIVGLVSSLVPASRPRRVLYN